ncbi:hypothetical protein LTR86_000803 [Recurvomyces mirabilis]|nr:hypothetical protein LTR86_000803 [Recurvomyces mirabilis]
METATPPDTAGKRKRTDSETPLPQSAPAAKVTKTGNNTSLSINYLARHSQEDLPLLNKDDPLPNLLQLLSAYSNVLDRHESLASNLGARPLGPILIKRFERCFDAPPKVVASHHKGAASAPVEGGHQITWLEVIEFARAHPGQFTLSTYSEGKKVCQFYYPQKQLRVQISEEDFLFINSGRCQELIPPLPIWEDEEKEVGTCDVLEVKLKELTNIADMVAARTRQLSHRLKGRRAAILERRAEGGSGTPAKVGMQQTTTAPGSSFVAVNTAADKPSGDVDTSVASFAGVRTELLRHFEGLPQNQNVPSRPRSRHHSIAMHPDPPQNHRHTETHDNLPDRTSRTSSLSPVPATLANDPLSYYISESTPAHGTQATPHTGSRPSISGPGYNNPSKHNFSRPLPPALESSQPFRPLCQAHMDSLPRGHRVIPPCDRCRRLRMDCVKNLTSCAGCTKKHARCHWRDVTREELGDLDHLIDSTEPDLGAHGVAPSYANGDHGVYSGSDDSDDDDSNPLEDLEALGEKEDQQEKDDEEGLRNARELSRQGREDGIRSTALSGQHTTLEASTSSAHPTKEIALEEKAPQVDKQPISEANVLVATDAGNPAATAAQASQLSVGVESPAAERPESRSGPDAINASLPVSSFMPLPEQPTMPSYGGFHAVNGTTAGASWRTA